MEAPVSTPKLITCKQHTNECYSEEEDPEDYPFPLTLRTKKPNGSGAASPALNGTDGAGDGEVQAVAAAGVQ